MSWLLTDIVRTSVKGATTNTVTDDAVVSTTARGARTTTKTVPAVTEAQNVGERTTNGENSVTVTEDAGGQISFVVPIRGGLNAPNPTPVCPV